MELETTEIEKNVCEEAAVVPPLLSLFPSLEADVIRCLPSLFLPLVSLFPVVECVPTTHSTRKKEGMEEGRRRSRERKKSARSPSPSISARQGCHFSFCVKYPRFFARTYKKKEEMMEICPHFQLESMSNAKQKKCRRIEYLTV